MLRKYPKLIAILLLLAFCQKVGLRLWMHHWLHDDTAVASKSYPSSAHVQVNCDCFDDAMTPMEGTSAFELIVPLPSYITSIAVYPPAIPSVEKVFVARRGPPALA